MDVHFNLNLNLQRVQIEGDIQGLGSANAILDYKEVKKTIYILEDGTKQRLK